MSRSVLLFILLLASLVAVADEVLEPLAFGGSAYCGGCHTDIYHQWNASAHHFSSFNNPIYRRVAETVLAEKGAETYSFCAGCHNPVYKRSAEFKTLDTNSWAANMGITCLSCHKITEIGHGNGDLVIEEPTLSPLQLANSRALSSAHETLIDVLPSLHRAVVSEPMYQTSDYCAACHSLTATPAINGATTMRFSNEIEQLRHKQAAIGNSHGSGELRCQDCHMPEVKSDDPAARDGLIRSHRFTGGNTALATFNRDFDQIEAVEAFLKNGIIRLQIVGMRTSAKAAFSDPSSLAVAAGDRIELAIRVFNDGAGHQFPNGTTDSNQAWLQATVSDASGGAFFTTGRVDELSPLPADAIRFGSGFVDALGNATDRRNTTTEAVSIASDSIIPVGGSRTVYLAFNIPDNAPAPYRIEARLNWRKYGPEFIDWVFSGRKTPPLPITTLASVEFELPSAKD